MVKVERSYPAPRSLETEATKAFGSYREPDVVERLISDFHDKCYICETKYLQDPEVEHLKSHYNRRILERVFDWDNLFLSCGHCNNVKDNKRYNEEIMNCCNRDPERYMTFYLNEGVVTVKANNHEDNEAVLTAELINKVFNYRNTGIRTAACELRVKGLMTALNVLYRELETYKANPESELSKKRLRNLLRRESEYAAFKRCYVRSRLSDYPDLYEFVEL